MNSATIWEMTPCSQKLTDISEECTASVSRVKSILSKQKAVAACSQFFPPKGR
jgi:hypothetical protein